MVCGVTGRSGEIVLLPVMVVFNGGKESAIIQCQLTEEMTVWELGMNPAAVMNSHVQVSSFHIFYIWMTRPLQILLGPAQMPRGMV